MKTKERRKLKANELSIFINNAYDFIKKRTKQVAAVIGIVAFIFLIFLVSRYIKAQNLQKQSELLAKINEVNQELYENPEKIQDLKELAGKGVFTRMGYIYLAKYYIEKQQFDEALSFLERVPESRKDLIYHQGLLLKAKIFKEQEEWDKALEIYQKIEENDPQYLALDIVLFNQAELFEKKDEKDKALELYRKISEDYPQTYYGYEASQKAEEMGEMN